MNKATLIGRLAADPELRQTGEGTNVTNFTIAVTRPYSGKESEAQTDWIDIVAWRHTAEFVCKYFQKGSPIVVEGTIQTRMWEDKAGQKRKAVEILAENVEFVPRTKESSEGESPVADDRPAVQPVTKAKATIDVQAENDDELPF